MTPDNQFTIPDLEQAVSEIRNDSVDPAVVEAAAGRVWAVCQPPRPSLLPIMTTFEAATISRRSSRITAPAA